MLTSVNSHLEQVMTYMNTMHILKHHVRTPLITRPYFFFYGADLDVLSIGYQIVTDVEK